MIPDNQVFATGYTVEPRLYADPEKKAVGLPTLLRWVAQKGYGYDWCIYYGNSQWTIDRVLKEGDKTFTPQVIRELVYCDDEVFERYRS